MLVSVPGPNAKTELRLPSHPNGIVMNKDVSPDYIPVSLRRKLFLINDHFAMGAAGSVIHVQKFVDDIKSTFQDKIDVSFGEIEEYLIEYRQRSTNQDVYENVGSIMLIEGSDRQGSLTKGINGHQQVESHMFGNATAIGKGGQSMIEAIDGLGKNYHYGISQPENGDEHFPEFHSLAANLCVIANAFWDEFASPESVFRAWGGAYDVVYQNAGRQFRFLDEYTLFLRVFDVNAPDLGIQPRNVLKYKRHEGYSFILTMNGNHTAVFGALDITSTDIPTTITLSKDDFDFNSNKIHISIIGVKKDNIWLRPMIQIDGIDRANGAKPTTLTWIDDEGRLCLGFQSEHDEWLEHQAQEYYEKSKHRFP